jgi:hypothetical protein
MAASLPVRPAQQRFEAPTSALQTSVQGQALQGVAGAYRTQLPSMQS